MPKPAPRLERATLTISRTLEYFTERELEMQIGVSAPKWPLTLTKELIDNALDACESDESGRLPAITVTLEGASITVEDNGPGLPEDTLRKSLDYTTRTSDKAHYVSPTRGQLGNALKCLWAGPFVHSGICGKEKAANIEITTSRYSCDIAVTVDQIRQTPRLNLIERKDRPNVKTGTIIKTEWPDTARQNLSICLSKVADEPDELERQNDTRGRFDQRRQNQTECGQPFFNFGQRSPRDCMKCLTLAHQRRASDFENERMS